MPGNFSVIGLLRSDSQTELSAAIKGIAKTRVLSADGSPEHFFEVQLRSLARVHNDVLLNDNEIYSYLSQVAPVPFSPDFQFGEVIADFLSRYIRYDTIDISIGENKKLFRPHSNQFPITDKVRDTFSGITFFEVPSIEDHIDAVGWLLTHSYFGAISKRAGVEGTSRPPRQYSDWYGRRFYEPVHAATIQFVVRGRDSCA